MRVLILGDKGFIGRSVYGVLKESDLEVFTIQDRIENTENIEEFILSNKINTIIHLVSSLIPSTKSEGFYDEFSKVIVPTYKLIDLAANLNIKFVFASSGGAIYGNQNQNEYREGLTKYPVNYYGFSKHIIEEYILFKNRTSNLEYLILRPSNVYGDYQSFKRAQGFIAVAIHKIFNSQELQIWGDGNNTKNYIYVKDFAEIITLLLKSNIKNETLNVCSESNYSLNEIIAIICKLSGLLVNVAYEDSKPFDVKFTNFSSEKLNAIIDFKFTPLSEGIKNQIECYKRIASDE